MTFINTRSIWAQKIQLLELFNLNIPMKWKQVIRKKVNRRTMTYFSERSPHITLATTWEISDHDKIKNQYTQCSKKLYFNKFSHAYGQFDKFLLILWESDDIPLEKDLCKH